MNHSEKKSNIGDIALFLYNYTNKEAINGGR